MHCEVCTASGADPEGAQFSTRVPRVSGFLNYVCLVVALIAMVIGDPRFGLGVRAMFLVIMLNSMSFQVVSCRYLLMSM